MRAHVVDAFTDKAFRGNPAGVVLLDATRQEGSAGAAWMQDVAAEFKHSETAFVTARPDGGYDLRWFTPLVEVNLCGHATLAAAHTLARIGARGPFTFHTRSGPLRASISGAEITLDFPAVPATPATAPDGLAALLGATPVGVYSAGEDLLVELADAPALWGIDPDIDALGALPFRGVIVTAPAATTPPDKAGPDFVSRFFGAAVGVGEDPVTGSAHCVLAPFWAARLGRTTLTGEQISARGGQVRATVRGDRVDLTGQAITVLEGQLLV